MRAAVFHDPQPARGDLILYPVIEQDHAVGHVLLQAVARQHPLAALSGHDRRHPTIIEPAEQPPQLGTQQHLVSERPEQRLHRVDHHPLGVDRIDRQPQPNKQPLEIPIPVSKTSSSAIRM